MTVKKQSKQKQIFRSAQSAVQNTVVFQGSPPFAGHWVHFTGSVLASTFVRRSLISWQARSVCISHVVSVFDAICWGGRQMPRLLGPSPPTLSFGPWRVVVEHSHSAAPPHPSGDFVPRLYSVMQSQHRTPGCRADCRCRRLLSHLPRVVLSLDSLGHWF